MPASKVCTKCRRRKSTSKFQRNPQGRDGLRARCAACLHEDRAAYRHQHKKQINEKGRLYHEKNKARIAIRRACTTYGLTTSQYLDLRKTQNYRCAICRRKKPLCVDHDHVTKRVRGFLCKACNVAVAQLGDNLPGLQRVITYLKSPTFRVAQ